MAFMLGMFAFANNSVENPVEEVPMEQVVTLENTLADLQTGGFMIYYTATGLGSGNGSGSMYFGFDETTTGQDVIDFILDTFFQ